MSGLPTVLDQMEELALEEDETEEDGTLRMDDPYDEAFMQYDIMGYGEVPRDFEANDFENNVGTIYDDAAHDEGEALALDLLYEVSEDNTQRYDEDGATEIATHTQGNQLMMGWKRKSAPLPNSNFTGDASELSSLLSQQKGEKVHPADTRQATPRRITISGPYSGSEGDSPMRSSRRRNLYRPSLAGSASDSTVTSEGNERTRTRPTPKSRNATVFAVSRLSTRRGTVKREISNEQDTLMDAVNRFTENSNDWENVAAAAAVVAASSQTPTKRGLVQFGRGDHVLVMLTLLNITNQFDDKDMFSTDPVNCFGYSVGEGTNEAQRHGPYKYVLCQVQTVHFDEDERYYTVTRMDTGSDQRADPGWMEPIKDLWAIENAMSAAQRTPRSQDAPKADKSGRLFWLAMSQMRLFALKALHFYKSARKSVKVLVENVVHGKDGYEMRFRCTAINLLVLCSLIYLFIDAVVLAFLSTDSDYAVTVVAS